MAHQTVASNPAKLFQAKAAPLLASMTANVANATSFDPEQFDLDAQALNKLYGEMRYMMIGGKLYHAKTGQ